MEKTDKQEILEEIRGLDQKLSGKIDGMEQRLSDQIDFLAREVHGIDGRLTGIDERFIRVEDSMVTKDHLETRFRQAEQRLVTKAYLDDKLANQHSDIVKKVKLHVSCWKDNGFLNTAK